jgi:3-hydroxybutyryl-CoA dehydrogenase
MQIVVLGNESYKLEIEAPVQWATSFEEFINTEADVYMDLLFESSAERINALKQLQPKTVIINSNLFTVKELAAPFVRINGWNSFLKGTIEGYAENENRAKAEEAFAHLNLKIEWLPDQVGFITPRVISMIINEAFFALAEGVSTKEEIDTAMKLGTAYPYGPFEWAEKIGLKNICELLDKLSKDQPRYAPADLLKQSINS